MPTFSMCTIVKILAIVTAVFVLSTIFKLPLDTPTGIQGLSLTRISSYERDFIARSGILESEDISWTRSANKAVTSNAPVDKKITKLVHRILEVEKTIISVSEGSLSGRQLFRLKQLTAQLKLVKTLFENSVFLMKLAEFASHGTDSSNWIAWDQLEPATRELEENLKALRLRDEKDPSVYVCFSEDRIFTMTFIFVSVICFLLAVKTARCLVKNFSQPSK